MKSWMLIVLLSLFPMATMAQSVPVQELEVHPVEPLLRVYGDIEFGGLRYIPTNAGLYIYGTDAAPLIHHAFSDSFPYNDLWGAAKRESDLLFFSGGWDDSCYPRTGYATNRIGVYRAEGTRLTEIAALPSWGFANPYVDPFDQVWVYVPPIMPRPFGQVYVMQGDVFPTAPMFTDVDVMMIHRPTGQVVVRHFMTEGPFAGSQFVTHDGQGFVPYTGTPQELVGIHQPMRNDLIPQLQDDFGWRPELGSVLDLQEASDGSVWFMDAELNAICLAKSNADTEVAYINEFSRVVMDSRLRRRTRESTETHATWLQDTFGNESAWIDGFSLSASGDPVLSINRSFDGAQSLPQAWWYSNVQNRLIYWEDPPSSFTPVYDVLVVGNHAVFAGETVVTVIRGNDIHRLELSAEWGTVYQPARLQRIAANRVRMYTFTGYPTDKKFSIDVVVSETGVARFETIREVYWADVAWMDTDANGTVWTGTSNGVRGTHPTNPAIVVEFPWMIGSSPTDILVRSNGEIWVASCQGVAVINTSGELLKRFGRHNGLSTSCALSLSEGASGNIHIGSAYGYTILGDPDLISGAPMSELTPTSIPKEEPHVTMGIALHQNHPNPFNPTTEIRFTLSAAETQDLASLRTRLAVHDILGREIVVLVEGVMPAGEHRVSFDASGLASGVYLYRLTTNGQSVTRRMVLLK
jgi:hypothetical protein